MRSFGSGAVLGRSTLPVEMVMPSVGGLSVAVVLEFSSVCYESRAFIAVDIAMDPPGERTEIRG